MLYPLFLYPMAIFSLWKYCMSKDCKNKTVFWEKGKTKFVCQDVSTCNQTILY